MLYISKRTRPLRNSFWNSKQSNPMICLTVDVWQVLPCSTHILSLIHYWLIVWTYFCSKKQLLVKFRTVVVSFSYGIAFDGSLWSLLQFNCWFVVVVAFLHFVQSSTLPACLLPAQMYRIQNPEAWPMPSQAIAQHNHQCCWWDIWYQRLASALYLWAGSTIVHLMYSD